MTSMVMDSHVYQSQASQQQQQPPQPQLRQQQSSISSAHQPLSSTNRHRAHSTTTLTSPRHPVNARGAIQKQTQQARDRTRAISTSQADRLFDLAVEQATQYQQTSQQQAHQPIGANFSWNTPQSSPQPQTFGLDTASLNTFNQWTVPTPPRSDSGIPSEPVTSASVQHFTTAGYDAPAAVSEMSSSLGFLLPSQYGSSPYDNESSNYPVDHNNIPPMRSSQPTTTSNAPAYSQSSSSPDLYANRGYDAGATARRHTEMQPPNTSATSHPHDNNYRRISAPQYQPMPTSHYSVAPSQSIPSISGLTQNPMQSPHVGSQATSPGLSGYHSGLPNRSYEPSPYSQQSYSSGAYQQGPPSYHSSPYVGSSMSELSAKPISGAGPPGAPSGAPAGADASIRVINQRPKPQCWDHGCNGRQFSTFSNLLRHQREKSGTATKSYCPKCGAEFTRTTARNGHLAHDKCTKQRRPSDSK